MRKCLFSSKIIIIALLSACLCGCNEEPEKKSRFGEVDAMQDGAFLSDNTKRSSSSETAEETEISEKLTTDSTIKTSKSLDVDDLPEGIARMVGVCDAINMACVENQKAYNQSDAELVWRCVHMYVTSCSDKKMKFTRVSEYVEADPQIISDVILAMFGKLRDIPPIPDSATAVEDGVAHMSISTGLQYRFSLGDRGDSAPEVRRVTQYSDGSLEMEVALVSMETSEEVVDFIYSMRANTRNTTTSAVFEYEITGSRSGDKLTSDKMNGMPFLVPVLQVYGYDSYPADDPKHNEVEEVMMLNSFQEHVPGMEEFNEKIRGEILSVTNSELTDDQWFDIRSYPVTSADYVQVATSVAVCPDSSRDPDVFCYNYSFSKSRIMDKNDALSASGMTEAQILERIVGLWEKDNGYAPGKITYRGFIIRRDSSVDMFYSIDTVSDEGLPYRKTIAYDPVSDKIRKVFEEGGEVIPASECDDTKPELTHGRKEDQTDGKQ